jgi:hypothetical protein
VSPSAAASRRAVESESLSWLHRFQRKPFEVYEFAALATYNSERARGIVHTPEWVARMVTEQERFGKQQRELYPDAIWVEAK